MWSVLLFAAAMTALGLYLLKVVWHYLRLRKAMRRWPRVPARVVGYRTELVKLIFMLVVAAALSLVAVFAGVALLRPRRR